MIPAFFPDDAPPGEKAVYAATRDSEATEDWLVLHSLGIADHIRHGENGLKAAPEDELLMVERVRTEHAAGNHREVERLVLHLNRVARILDVDLSEQTVAALQEVMEGRTRARFA